MSKLQIGHHFSVSLAHKYWVKAYSSERNHELFGELSSPNGLGHNFDVSLFLSEQMDEREQHALAADVKSHWDHRAFLDLKEDECSSLEALLWNLIHIYGDRLERVEVRESEEVSLMWDKALPLEFTLAVTQFLSVLWKQGGGSRVRLKFKFKGPFDPRAHVLVPRKLLFESLYVLLREKELKGFELSLDVKENEEILDALFKELKNKIPLLDSIEWEIENQKKWLIHTVKQTR